MTAAYESDTNPIWQSLAWPDESMLIRVLRCETLDARLLQADTDNHGILHQPLLHDVMNIPENPYALTAFKELLKFGEMRDQVSYIFVSFGKHPIFQISLRSGAEHQTALHYAVRSGRDDLLHLLLASTTDAALSVRMLEHSTAEGRTPRQLAKMMKRRRCVQVIDAMGRMGKKKIVKVEKGYAFDCC